jgi:hypothetical protein
LKVTSGVSIAPIGARERLAEAKEILRFFAAKLPMLRTPAVDQLRERFF